MAIEEERVPLIRKWCIICKIQAIADGTKQTNDC